MGEAGQPRRKIGLLLILLAAVGALAAFDGIRGNVASSDQSIAPPLASEPLPPGPLPGRHVRGDFRGAGLGRTREAQELAVTGKGSRRTTLLIARGERDQLCFAVTVGPRARRAS